MDPSASHAKRHYTPVPEYPAWDPATPYGDLFKAKAKKPACSDPIWSPTMDDKVMNQTLAIAERLNIVGVLSGPATRVAAWVKANPRRFIRGLSCIHPGMVGSAPASTSSLCPTTIRGLP